MFNGLKTWLYTWYAYRTRKGKTGITGKEFRRLKKKPAAYTGNETAVLHGNKISFNSPFWFLHGLDEIFVEEVYRFSPRTSNPVIIDCGANIGLSVIYFKKICPNAQILAFEADPSIFDILKRNVEAFSLTGVELYNQAIWTENSTLDFDAEGTVGGKLGLGKAPIKNKKTVSTIKLATLLDKKIDFLKIDIEGAEYEVIMDCSDKLGNVDNLFIEYHVMNNEDQRLDEILQLLKRSGFRYYIKEAWHNQVHPFISKKGEGFEMQLNISCYKPS